MKRCPFCETTYADHHTTCGNEGCEGHGSRLVISRQLEPGTLIGKKYRIVGFIGRGGMGTVYLAEHIHFKERHALKFISADLTENPKVLNRFQLEAQTLRRLTDPNIVTIYDLDQADDGAFYIAMEFVDGLSLSEIISAGPLPVERALAIARGVASGLAAAHAKQIVHRDIKPDNILLDHSAFHSAGIDTPKLLDFGIAAVKETSVAMSRTRGFMLTAEYAAPEQWTGMPADQLDGRTDLYALGGVLHEMLTGTTCLHSQTFDGWLYQHLQVQPFAPSQFRPELAQWPGLDALVLSLLAKDRNHRPANAIEAIRRLDEVKQWRLASVAQRNASPPIPQPTTQKSRADAFKHGAPALSAIRSKTAIEPASRLKWLLRENLVWMIAAILIVAVLTVLQSYKWISASPAKDAQSQAANAQQPQTDTPQPPIIGAPQLHVVGGTGTILRSNDGGSTWVIENSGTTSFLSSVTFPTAELGWAIGAHEIFHTEDGGSNWMLQKTVPSYGDFGSVTFSTEQTGLAVNHNSLGSFVLRTTDGGRSWDDDHTPNRTSIGAGIDVHSIVCKSTIRMGCWRKACLRRR